MPSDHILDRQTREWICAEILPYEGEVRRWVDRAAPPGLETADVIQEAYSRISRLPPGSEVRSGRAYFFSVARNIVREHFRRQRVVRIEPLAELDQLNLVDEGASAERVFAARQEVRVVWRLMDRLPDRCRRIFLLRKVEGLSQKEIARAVGVTENVVEKQIALGLRQLLKLLAEETAANAAAADRATAEDAALRRLRR